MLILDRMYRKKFKYDRDRIFSVEFLLPTLKFIYRHITFAIFL